MRLKNPEIIYDVLVENGDKVIFKAKNTVYQSLIYSWKL